MQNTAGLLNYTLGFLGRPFLPDRSQVPLQNADNFGASLDNIIEATPVVNQNHNCAKIFVMFNNLNVFIMNHAGFQFSPALRDSTVSSLHTKN